MSESPTDMTTQEIFAELDSCFCDDVGQYPLCQRCQDLIAEYETRVPQSAR
jgi:hypothetical protein